MVMGTSGLGLVGNLLGATAGSVNVLIGSSICNGLAASGQLSFGIVLGELVPNKYRGPMMTLVFLSSLPFAGKFFLWYCSCSLLICDVTVFGPVIARTFIIHSASGWRWSYYLGIIMSCVALVLYQFMYHPPTYTQLHVKGKTKRQQLGELDYGGMALFTAGMVLFLISLSWGGTTYAWESVQVLSTLILGVLTLTAFILYGSSCHSPRAHPKGAGLIACRRIRRSPKRSHPSLPL
jgi:MFS family permease